MKKVAALLFATLTAWSAMIASAAELKVAFGQEKPPYIWFDKGEVHGLELDLVRAALALSDYTVVAKALPNKRLTATFSGEDFDIATGLHVDDIPGALYSDDYMEFSNFAITKKSKNIQLNSIQDIFRYSVATWQNAYQDLSFEQKYPADVKAQKNAGNFTEFPSLERGTKFFWADRADIMLCDRSIFLWYAKLLAKEIDTSEPVVFHDLFSPQNRVKAAFKDKKVRDAFDEGFRKLRASGEYDKIFAKYTKMDRPPG